MSTATATPLMTAEEMLALPDNGMDRDLILGQLRERPMTTRCRRHARTTTRLARLLENWLVCQPMPRGEVLTGDAGFRLRRAPDTTAGIDVAYISAQLARQTPEDVSLIDGAPILAVEILSPSDTHERVVEKIELFLEAGVPVVWIVDPDLKTVTVYRPVAEPVLFNASQELSGDPDLPGFQLRVAELFEQ
jgi:Uma2 family endonuclease